MKFEFADRMSILKASENKGNIEGDRETRNNFICRRAAST